MEWKAYALYLNATGLVDINQCSGLYQPSFL